MTPDTRAAMSEQEAQQAVRPLTSAVLSVTPMKKQAPAPARASA